ncbi:hypothetical protein M426DRAFT_319836 [Hypoxylon sp. CI-4A]|nr:hypothetical protein M426DRAFT_319836 [Hypoxylon sp. CI-4A]
MTPNSSTSSKYRASATQTSIDDFPSHGKVSQGRTYYMPSRLVMLAHTESCAVLPGPIRRVMCGLGALFTVSAVLVVQCSQ